MENSIIADLKNILDINEWNDIADFFNHENTIHNCIKECSSPDKKDIFNAFKGLKPQDVKVLIIGQDPYPDKNRAHGLAFSFANNAKAKDSLENIFQKSDIKNKNTNLTRWKEQGVLLLNMSLSYNAKNQDYHIKSWKKFVNNCIEQLLKVKQSQGMPLVIMLWGRKANEELKCFKYKGIEFEEEYQKIYPKCLILRSSHPSNNYNACNANIFSGEITAFNNKKYQPFRKCNEFLSEFWEKTIEW